MVIKGVGDRWVGNNYRILFFSSNAMLGTYELSPNRAYIDIDIDLSWNVVVLGGSHVTEYDSSQQAGALRDSQERLGGDDDGGGNATGADRPD